MRDASHVGNAEDSKPAFGFNEAEPRLDYPYRVFDLPFLSEQAKRNILGGNAMRVFNLKLPAQNLARVA